MNQEELSSEQPIDELTWEQAKPHFIAVLKAFRDSDKSLKEFVAFLAREYGEGIRPYLHRFQQELQSGAIDLEERPMISGHLMSRVKRHWKEFLPSRYQLLVKENRLEAEISEAWEEMVEAEVQLRDQLEKQGMNPAMAQLTAAHEMELLYLFLPPEESEWD